MRRTIIIALLLLTACADKTNQPVPGTDLFVRDYGPAPYSQNKDVLVVRLMFKGKTGQPVFDEVSVNCANRTIRDDESDWKPVNGYTGMTELANFVCS